MKKKLLIASFFASIMLLVPFSAISGGSVIGNVAKVEGNAEPYPVIPDYLLEDLYNIINLIFVKYGHDSDIGLLCQEILDIIDGQYDSEFCNSLYQAYIQLGKIWQYYWEKDPLAPDWGLYAILCGAVWGIWFVFCAEQSEQTLNLNSITHDTSVKEELIQTNQVNLCPCGQQR